jgi:hypothetical protein
MHRMDCESTGTHPFDSVFAASLMATEISIEENPGVYCQRTASLTIYYSHIIVEYSSSFGRQRAKNVTMWD